MRPRLLDLFCGAGGAAMGYHRAGFDVVGVDVVDQPNYPFPFLRADALHVLRCNLDGNCYPWEGRYGLCLDTFHAIHASPPCQAHTTMSSRWRGQGGAADSHEDLIGATRTLLEQTGLPWVIENVEGARSEMGGRLVRICGSAVGLEQSRHRLFECGGWIALVPSCTCRGHEYKNILGVKPDGRWLRRKSDGTRANFVVSSVEEARELMGIDWMDWRELCEAIPPAYTELIGAQLIGQLGSFACVIDESAGMREQEQK